eukprot:gene279-529_t
METSNARTKSIKRLQEIINKLDKEKRITANDETSSDSNLSEQNLQTVSKKRFERKEIKGSNTILKSSKKDIPSRTLKIRPQAETSKSISNSYGEKRDELNRLIIAKLEYQAPAEELIELFTKLDKLLAEIEKVNQTSDNLPKLQEGNSSINPYTEYNPSEVKYSLNRKMYHTYLDITKIPADGHCMYVALARAANEMINDSKVNWNKDTMRLQLIEYLHLRGKEIEILCFEEGELHDQEEAICKQESVPVECWGNENTLIAFSCFFQANVYIISSHSPSYKIIPMEVCAECKYIDEKVEDTLSLKDQQIRKNVFLQYDSRIHYNFISTRKSDVQYDTLMNKIKPHFDKEHQ